MCLINAVTLPLSQIEARSVSVDKPDKKEVDRIHFTFMEAQEFLGVSHQTLYKLMKEGLPSHKIGKKRVFLKEDLVRWIKEH